MYGVLQSQHLKLCEYFSDKYNFIEVNSVP